MGQLFSSIAKPQHSERKKEKRMKQMIERTILQGICAGKKKKRQKNMTKDYLREIEEEADRRKSGSTLFAIPLSISLKNRYFFHDISEE